MCNKQFFLAKYLDQSLQYGCKVHKRSSRRVSISVSESSSVDMGTTDAQLLFNLFCMTTHDVTIDKMEIIHLSGG